MRSSKSRSRGKNRSSNNRSMGNVVNRVFDSSGPEGKVRGTPQQIIDKYLALHRDAQLSNDRVAAENFQQHAEHYARMLGAAVREQEAKRASQEAQQRERAKEREEREQAREQARGQSKEQASGDAPSGGAGDPRESGEPRRPVFVAGDGGQPDVIDLDGQDDGDSGLVETVESAPKPRRSRSRKPKASASGDEGADSSASDEKPAAE
ncbi:MAG: DUF4167 domain-containing protein [Paracoccaceae bacterium]